MSSEIKITVIGQETYSVGLTPAMKARAVIELEEYPEYVHNGYKYCTAHDEITVKFSPIEGDGPIVIKKTEYDKIAGLRVSFTVRSNGNVEVIDNADLSDLRSAHKKYVKEIAQIEAEHYYKKHQTEKETVMNDEVMNDEVMNDEVTYTDAEWENFSPADGVYNAYNEDTDTEEEEEYGICPAHIFLMMCHEAGVEHEATHDALEIWLKNGFDEWAEDLGISAHKSDSLFISYLAERTMILISHEYRTRTA